MSDRKAVIVFSFYEPTNTMDMALIIEKAKSVFEDENKEDMKVYLGVKEAAKQTLDIFERKEEDEGNLVKHAKRELSLIENDEEFNEAIIEAVRGFSKYGHSGGSASVAIPLLNELLQFKNLTPLTDNPNEWNKVNGEDIWQNNRNSEAFSNDGGNTYYLLSEGGHDQNREPLHISEKSK